MIPIFQNPILFIVAALKRGHPCIGIDIDKNAIELTRKRIATVISAGAEK